MLYTEDYVVVNIGLISNVNQDNIYSNGIYLDKNNKGINNYKLKTNRLNKNLLYAVFDGIGGLSQGEHASYVASNILSKNTNNNIDDILNKINEVLIEYGKENNIKIGTTASIVKIKNSIAEIYQVGDSPIYIFRDNNVTKFVEHDCNDNLLDNYLGAKEKIKIIKKQIKLKNKDKILICSDGLSKEVGINEIEYILGQKDDVKYISEKLLNFALKCGGKDNISIIIIEVKRKYDEIILSILFALFILILVFIITKGAI